MRAPSATAAYSAVKDQLVSLSLEVEDCSHAAELLKEALDREQQAATDLPREVGAMYEEELEAGNAKDKSSLSQHLQTVDKLLTRKRELSGQAKMFLQQIKETQRETAAAIEQVREQGRAEILDAQATWAQGEEIRREKWMAKRAREVRELTLKGLEPEIERIMDKHRANLEEATRAHHREEQRLRQQAALRAEEMLGQERSRVRSQVEQTRRQAREELAERRQVLMDKHQAHLDRLRERTAGEAAAQRRWQDEELRRIDGTTTADMARRRKEEHARLQEMRLQHAEDMAAASRRSAATLSSLTRQSELDREGWERSAKESACAGMEEAFREEEKRLLAARDKDIDAAIRRLQKERLDREKACKAEADAEAHRLDESHAEGLRLLKEKEKQWTERQDTCAQAIHVLVESRREHALASREAEADLGLASVKVQTSEAALREGASSAREEESAVLKEHQELMVETRAHRAELKDRLKRSEQETSASKSRIEAERSRLQREHDARLESLHQEVKQKVASLDDGITSLSEAVHTESLRAEHAAKMLAKYVKRAAAAADAAAGGTGPNDAGRSNAGPVAGPATRNASRGAVGRAPFSARKAA